MDMVSAVRILVHAGTSSLEKVFSSPSAILRRMVMLFPKDSHFYAIVKVLLQTRETCLCYTE